MNRENQMPCFVFPMGIEAGPFLNRVQIVRRWTVGKATYREVFFEGTRLLVVRCGMGPAKAKAALGNLDRKPSLILCAGTAGALDPDLRLGELFVASHTKSENDRNSALECSPDLTTLLAGACTKEGLPFRSGGLVTVSAAVFPTEDRLRLHRKTGAAAVDMESHAVADKAGEMGIPFACLRVISDDVYSTRVPRKPSLKQLKNEPSRLFSMLSTAMHLWRFMRNFRASVNKLHPVLIRLIRDASTK